MSTTPEFRERLHAPLSWWLVAMLVGVPVAAAIGIYLGWWQTVVITVVTIIGIAWALLSYGTRVEATDAGLRAGDWTIGWEHVGTATALGREATRERLGPGAVATAGLVVRPYVPLSVEVTIVDPADPHPYWLISSRRPTALAAAINARAAHAHDVTLVDDDGPAPSAPTGPVVVLDDRARDGLADVSPDAVR